jgi:hypothetical protein
MTICKLEPNWYALDQPFAQSIKRRPAERYMLAVTDCKCALSVLSIVCAYVYMNRHLLAAEGHVQGSSASAVASIQSNRYLLQSLVSEHCDAYALA